MNANIMYAVYAFTSFTFTYFHLYLHSYICQKKRESFTYFPLLTQMPLKKRNGFYSISFHNNLLQSTSIFSTNQNRKTFCVSLFLQPNGNTKSSSYFPPGNYPQYKSSSNASYRKAFLRLPNRNFYF